MSVARFEVERFRRLLRTRALGQTCYDFDVLDSTNASMHALGRLGMPEGTTVLAERQTAGRGQADRVWISPPGHNLYVSVLLRPSIAPGQAPLIALLAAVALVDTLRREGADCAIKWPNDVLIQRRKVAGILTEMVAQGEAIQFVVVGIGVNVNMTQETLEHRLGAIAHSATSLQVALGRALCREGLLAALMESLEQWYHQFGTHGPQVLLDAWEARSAMPGRRISARTPEASCEGVAEGVDQSGQLRLRRDDGALVTLASAEVRFLD